ncbi:MAG: hypothetical protein M3Q95_08080 [Bacteroidota bacterium]|nr:hypothetical protein [Bacteroidota bacterium]
MSKIYIYILLPICLCITHISYAQTTSDDSTKNKRTYLKMGHEFYQTNGNFMLNGRFNSTWIELSPLICKVPITLIFQYSTFFDHSNTSHKYRFSFKYNKQTNLPNYDTSNLLNDSIIELNKKLAINKNIFEKNFNQHFLKTFHVPEMKSSVLAVDTFNMSSSFQLPYDSACIYINNYANQLEKYKTEYDALSTINDSLSPLNSNNSADYKKRKIELNKLDIGQNTLSESPLTLYDIQYSGILTEIDYNNFILQVAGGNLYDNKNLYSLNFFNTSHDSLSFFKFSSGYDFEKNKVKIGGIFYYNGINLKNLSHKTSIISFQNQTNLNKNNQLKITVASSIASTNNISENSYNLYDAGAISITTSHFIPKSSTSINISFQTLGKTYNNPGNKFLLPGDKCKKINITQPLTKSKKVSIHSEISSNSNKVDIPRKLTHLFRAKLTHQS